MKAPVYILEGTWWSRRELPLILPYFQALAASHGDLELSHRTIRSVDDIGYYVRKLGKNERAFLYFACHGENMSLAPAGGRQRVTRGNLLAALREHKPGAIAFLHFGSCQMVDAGARRKSLKELLDASEAQWVSGYTNSVDWLRSTFLDLALVAEFYVQFHAAGSRRGPKLKAAARRFIANYEQLAREVGLSGLSRVPSGHHSLFPPRLRG